MIKKLLVFLFLFLFFICGFYTSQQIIQKEVVKAATENKQCQSQLQDVLATNRKTSTQDLNLFTQKTQELEKVVESTVYFSSQSTPLSDTKTKVVISLIGGDSMKSDASDLMMRYSENLTILEIIPGDAFPSYPRKATTSGEITITGIASLENNEIKFGEPNKVFTSLIFEKTGNLKEKGTITIDKGVTQIYLQGKSIIDANKTLKQIEL